MRTATFMLLGLLATATGFEPARLRSAPPMARLPVEAVGGGEVFLEAGVDTAGHVVDTITLRSTPPYVDPLREAVSRWRFRPAREDGETVASRVLVAAVFHSPTLYGPSLGESGKDVAAPSEAVPFPSVVLPALHPPDALWEGTVVVEARVGEDGIVTEARVVVSGQRYDDAARDAVLKWQFKPAGRKGSPVAVYAYLVFGFRQPVTTD